MVEMRRRFSGAYRVRLWKLQHLLRNRLEDPSLTLEHAMTGAGKTFKDLVVVNSGHSRALGGGAYEGPNCLAAIEITAKPTEKSKIFLTKNWIQLVRETNQEELFNEIVQALKDLHKK